MEHSEAVELDFFFPFSGTVVQRAGWVPPDGGFHLVAF